MKHKDINVFLNTMNKTIFVIRHPVIENEVDYQRKIRNGMFY